MYILILKSKDDIVAFNIFKISDCRFFVRSNSIIKFKKDIEAFIHKSAYLITSKYFSINLTKKLGHKYFCIQLRPMTVTPNSNNTAPHNSNKK